MPSKSLRLTLVFATTAGRTLFDKRYVVCLGFLTRFRLGRTTRRFNNYDADVDRKLHEGLTNRLRFDGVQLDLDILVRL